MEESGMAAVAQTLTACCC